MQLFTRSPIFVWEVSPYLHIPLLGRGPYPTTSLYPLFCLFPGYTEFLPPPSHCSSQSCLHVPLNISVEGSLPPHPFSYPLSSSHPTSPAAAPLPTIRLEFPFTSLGTTLDLPFPPGLLHRVCFLSSA